MAYEKIFFFKVGLLIFLFYYQTYANIIAPCFRGYFLQQVFAIQNDSGKETKIWNPSTVFFYTWVPSVITDQTQNDVCRCISLAFS